VTVVSKNSVALGNSFARELPELALEWRADEAPDPRLLLLNETLATELGLDPASLRRPDGVRLLVGNLVPGGATPVAQAYAGHQFGGYSPRLGDGRALLLGELVDASSGRLQDLHLKGSGRTPFARGGDGLAAVGPMVREYIISEAMHALGIPTTRALAVSATGRSVRRETSLPGAVLARVASSHLRVGSFQFARSIDDPQLLRRLADYAIARHYPEAAHTDRPYLSLFEAVVAAQAELVAQWMLVGFVHGVMNTDNMTISGETIDYGPCAFMEGYDPATVFSSIDGTGRYAYGRQPIMAQWNLARLAEALLPLVDVDEQRAIAEVQASLDAFSRRYDDAWMSGMLSKLGLAANIDAGSAVLISDLLNLMRSERLDFTLFFRLLSAAVRGDAEPARGNVLNLAALDDWMSRWVALQPDAAAMDRVNPLYIPRNHLVEEALSAATDDGDVEPVKRLLDAVTDPYTERPGLERYAEAAPSTFLGYRTFCGT
jgi:serine/tyrosine/threonine adenylyltransferase